ncbi:MAG: hypothetical protein CL816_02515 [Coxiellaceae bacterium]|nr:hypothetical protein [Coxiellaceae bacterium]|tara:strand:- start:4740 stop:5075 length:336 start_codon:yes stop_codon:yes gene_type:complete
MDGMHACRRLQYIQLISEMHCLPKLPADHIVSNLAVINQIESAREIGLEKNYTNENQAIPISLISNFLLMGSSILELFQSVFVSIHRFFACIIIMFRDWLPVLQQNTSHLS